MSDRRTLLIVAGLLLALALAVTGVFLRWKAGEPRRQYERTAQTQLELCLSRAVTTLDTNTCLDDYDATLRKWDAR